MFRVASKTLQRCTCGIFPISNRGSPIVQDKILLSFDLGLAAKFTGKESDTLISDPLQDFRREILKR